MKKCSSFLAGLFIGCFWSIAAFAQGNFIRGDANCDGVVDSTDVAAVNTCVFSGPCPCQDAADVNDDGILSPPDVTYLGNYLNSAGPLPPNPFPECGPDPTADGLTCATSCCIQANHYRTWQTTPITVSLSPVQARDQFRTENLQLIRIDHLSNPVRKIVGSDTTNIVDPDDHLLWYQVTGSSSLNLSLRYTNQFQTNAFVTLGSVAYFLVPAQKSPHPPYDSLDHYKAYFITNPTSFGVNVRLRDQFDLFNPDQQVTSLVARYFLAPAQKNNEPTYDMLTHYVAYEISPQGDSETRTVTDQFGVRTVNMGTTRYLLVPTMKFYTPPECNDGMDNDGDGFTDYPADCGCTSTGDATEAPNPITACSDGIDNDGDGLVDLADPDCANLCDNLEGVALPHYKTWTTNFLSIPPETIQFRDQFQTQQLTLTSIQFLSNPAQKIVASDTFNIVDPDDHLLWYQIQSSGTSFLRVNYVNQFEDTSRVIQTGFGYFLVPAQKLPHPTYDSLDHYRAYPIAGATPLNRFVQLQDQFDVTPEQITSLFPQFFLTPAQKNAEPVYDSVTHYVAYAINPPRTVSQTRTVIDQFGSRTVTIGTSRYLLVPTRKTGFGPPECSDGLDNDGDGQVDYPADCGCSNPIDDSEAPDPTTQCNDGIDNDGDGLIDLGDCGCASPCDFTESPNPTTQCSDGVDNDGDGLIDLADPDCANVCDTNEFTPVPECSDGVDNDGDGLVDFPADCGCTDAADLTEAPNPPGQCSDGVDNDGDGLVDLADPDCANVCDPEEGVSPILNHYKSWRTEPVPFLAAVTLKDQFIDNDTVLLRRIDFLSNPARKITPTDTTEILRPNDHLTWYQTSGRNFPREIHFRNQFGEDTVRIDTLDYLLVPAQKLPHPQPDRLDHYKCYRIRNPRPFDIPIGLQDQFDIQPELKSQLLPKYLCTPCQKNSEPVYDTVTHYVGYSFVPGTLPVPPRIVIDQFGQRELNFVQSELLLVPSDKTFVCPCAKGDANCDGVFSPSDVVCVLNCVFLGGANPPCVCNPCVTDTNCDGTLSPSDVVLELNRVFLGITALPWCGS